MGNRNTAAIHAPSSRHVQAVEQACRQIETGDPTPSLAALADEAGFSPQHFQRVFKAITGLTPKAYALAHRGRALRAALTRRPVTVTAAAFDAGFMPSIASACA